MSEKPKLTGAKQALEWFKGYTEYGSDQRSLAEKIIDYAEEHSLVIKQIDYNFSSKPMFAYVLFEKRSMNQCGQCPNEAEPGDYLCSSCRSSNGTIYR